MNKTKKIISCLTVMSMLVAYAVNAGAAVHDYLVSTSFDSMGEWVTAVPTGSVVETVNDAEGADGGALHILGAAKDTSATYNRTQKYTFNYESEFRLKIVKNTGTIVVNLYPGTERTQINITSNGTKISVPVRNGSTDKQVNKTATITDVIPDYNAQEWHTWRVVTIDHVQTIYVDGTVVFSDYTQNPWSNNLMVQFWANANNEYYVDYFTFGDTLINIDQKYGKETAMFDLSKDTLTNWKTDASGGNQSAKVTNSGVTVTSTGKTSTYAYAQRGIAQAANMRLDFDMSIPSFSKENTVTLRNDTTRIQVTFTNDSIQCRNSSNSMTTTAVNVGTGYHHWTFVLYGSAAYVYMDNNLITNYVPHKSQFSPRFVQFVCNSNADATASMEVKNITLINLTNSTALGAAKLDVDMGSVTGKLSYTNASTSEANLTAVLAEYDSSGRLVNIKITPYDIEAGSYGELNSSAECDANAVKAKLFIWDSVNGMYPLAGDGEYQYET